MNKTAAFCLNNNSVNITYEIKFFIRENLSLTFVV